MKKNNLITKISTLAAAVAMTVGANNAFAASNTLTADATIFNEVVVSYQALNGTVKTAEADVTVQVRLVEAFTTITKLGDELDSTDGEISVNYAVSSNATGIDSYTISATEDSNAEETIFVTDSDGNNSTVLTGALEIGAGIVVAVDSAGVSFPGGSAFGLETDDYIIIDGTTYQVGTILVTGNAKSSSEDETYDKIELKNLAGNTIDPSSIVSVGDLLSETVFIQTKYEYDNDTNNDVNVTVGLEVTSPDEDGTDNDNRTTAGDGDASNDLPPVVFKPANIDVQKLVKVEGGDATEYLAEPTDQPFPGDELYYQLIVTPTGANTKEVVLTDVIPDYTTYKPGSTEVTFNGTATTLDDVNTPNSVQVPDQFDGGYDSNTLTIRLGSGVSDEKGGVLTPTDTITITYTVTVD